MAERQPDGRTGFGWGLATSLVLHGLIALMLTGAISGYVTEPLQDTVEVELVAPPEEEEALEPEPEPAPAEEEQPVVETPPPPPPPPPAAPEQPPAAEAPPAETVPQPPVLQPVEQFGEEDTGPRGEAEDTPPVQAEPDVAEAEPQDDETPVTDPEAGTTEETGGESEPDPQETDTTSSEPVEAEPDTADEVAAGETEAGEGPTEEPEQTEAADTADAEAPQTEDAADQAGTEALADAGIAEEAPAEDFGTVGPITTNITPAPKPAPPAAGGQRPAAPAESSGPPPGMVAARQLFSRDILDDPQARSAMRGMSEGQRLNLLCMTELRAQITAVSAFPPELLPSFRPPPGNVLQPRSAAFRSLGRWFDVSFRCETDSGVTRVETFAFRIGNEIPQSQWGARGLTGF
ncbi:MAG: hypothetical protein Tsb0019_17800 [Roseibium sp.]